VVRCCHWAPEDSQVPGGQGSRRQLHHIDQLDTDEGRLFRRTPPHRVVPHRERIGY